MAIQEFRDVEEATGAEEAYFTALRLASEIHNTATEAARTGNWRPMEEMFLRLDRVRFAFKDDPEIAGNDALATYGAIAGAAQAAVNTGGGWRRVRALFERFDSLRRSFPHDRYIARMYAQSALHMIDQTTNEGAENPHWNQVDLGFAQLEALRAAFSDDLEIARYEAQAITNTVESAMTAAFQSGDWGKVEDLFTRRNALCTAFSQDPKIAIEDARTRFNTVNSAAQAAVDSGDWYAVDVFVSQAVEASKAFQNEPTVITLMAATIMRRYFYRQYAGLEPDRMEALEAVSAASLVLRTSANRHTSDAESKDFVVPALQTIKHAYGRFPKEKEILYELRVLEEQEIDILLIQDFGKRPA